MNRTDRKDPCAPQARYNGLSFDEFNTLATYNAEVARGIMHTTQWKVKMAALQQRWDGGEARRGTFVKRDGTP
jgi:hypothetical protein